MKNFTMLLLMMFGAVSFAQQSTLKENGKNNPIHYNQQRSKTVVIPDGQPGAETEILNLGENKPIFYDQQQTKSKSVGSEQETSATYTEVSKKESTRTENERALDRSITVGDKISNKGAQLEKSLFGTSDLDELLAAEEENRRGRSATDFSVQNAEGHNKIMAQIIPTAGATETFAVDVGDFFYDPSDGVTGGPGGDCSTTSSGDPGDYPNCGCATITTLTGTDLSVEFLTFRVFGTFDYLNIYDGPNTSSPKIYDSNLNSDTDTLAGMIAAHGSGIFNSTSDALTFEFYATTVVNTCGWEVEVISGGGGGGTFPDPYCGPLEYNNDVEPITLVEVADISNRSDAAINGSPAHEDFTAIIGNMEEGETYTIALEGNTNGGFTCSFTVFIDWNQDGILDNNTERFEIGTIVGSTGEDGQQATGTITVPAGAVEGPTRMRVMKRFGSTYAPDSCTGGSGWGQAEDYTIEITADGGGGGGVACAQDHPFGASAAGGSGSSVDSDFKTAADVVVVAGENFTLDTIEVPFMTFAPEDPPVTANVVYYSADSAGLPGTVIGSETVVPTILSAVPWANPIAFQFKTRLEMTPFTFLGDASSDTTYWIEISMGTVTNQGTVFWEYTDDIPVEGQPYAKFDASVGIWEIEDPNEEVIYTFSGECEAIGGGGGGVCANPVLEVNQDLDDTCMANISQGGLAQSFIALETEAAGAGIKFRDPSTGLDVDLSLWDGLPNAGGTMLASGTSQTDGTEWTDVLWPDVVNVTVGNTYYIVIDGDTSLPCVSGSTNDPYPDGMLYANDFNPFPTFDYTFRTFSCDTGGGTGYPCSEVSASNSLENGKSFTQNLGRIVAADITIAADQDMLLETINITALMGTVGSGVNAANVDVYIYADSGTGSPGAVLDSQIGLVPSSQTVIGNNFGYDAWSVDLDIADFNLPGQAGVETTYWIGLSLEPTDGTNTFWEYKSIDVNGYGLAYNDGTGFVVEPTNEVVYTFAGTCTGTVIIPGDDCGITGPSNSMEDGKSFTKNLGRIVANDIAVPADSDMLLEKITISAFIGGVGSGVNAANVDVFIYENNSGAPGALVTSQTSLVPTSQTVIGSNFGYDLWEVVLDIDDVDLPGTFGAETTYWIGLSLEPTDGSNTFWEFSSAGVIGYGLSYNDGTGFVTEPGNEGVYVFEATCGPMDTTPVNDECSGAIAMNCGESVTGTTVDATIDSGAPTCGPSITSPGVWYTLDDTSGMAGEITFSLCDGTTTFDTKLSIYTGSCSALVCVAGNDDSCGLQSSVTVPTDGNTKFYILVHSFGGETGTFTLDATCTPTPPPNDKIANSIYVTPIGFPYTDPSVAMPAATPEAGNPQGCDLTGANGVWYHFTSSGDGIAEASITTPGGASSVTFYSAPSLNAVETDLVLVPQNSNQCVPGTSASIYTLAGGIYYVFVLNSGAVTDIVIDGTNLGVGSNTLEGFTYYPNPTDGVLNLSSKDNIETVTLYNLLGQTVLVNKVGATSTTLDISGLSVGTYMMKATVNGQVGVYKIVKK